MNLDQATERRLSVALVLSFVCHAAIIGGVGIAPPPQPDSPRTLRASIIPYSFPNAARIDAPESIDAPRELDVLNEIARRDPSDSSDIMDWTTSTAERDRTTGPRISAELPIYYKNDELDVRATPRHVSNLSRTSGHLALGRMVTVKLRLFIAANGTLDHFEILESEGLNASISLNDISDITFYPAQRQGRPVASQKVIELRFLQ